MSLELVSLTGADDCVAPEALAALSAQYPFAEWAILYFPEKEGSPRNPSGAWREKFLALKLPYTAAHLCGSQVFRELLNPELAPSRITDLSRYRRIQLNINARRQEFTDEEVLAIYRTLLDAGLHLILQYHDASRRVIQMFVAEAVPESLSRIGILYDASKGTGQRPEFWPPMSTVGSTPLFCGYAGGLGPDVLEGELPRIREAATAWRDLPFWIDMESGLRTDGEFDLSKAESVLCIASGRNQSLVRSGVYFASKVVHATRWQAMRDSGVTTASTWIDEAGEGQTADYAELSERCLNEIAQAERLVLYCQPGEILKGALLEAGAALMAGTPVFLVGECESLSRVFRKHALWHECASVEEAVASPVGYPLELAVRHRLACCEDALRTLAIYLGVGGYNAPTVDGLVFAEKIRWGIDHILSVEQQRKAATPASVFLVTGTRYGYKEDTTWTLTSWPTKEAAEAHVAFLEGKLQEAADQVAEGCTTGLDYPDREKIEALMVEHDKQLELGTNGAGWSVEEVPLRTDVLAFSVKEPV